MRVEGDAATGCTRHRERLVQKSGNPETAAAAKYHRFIAGSRAGQSDEDDDNDAATTL